MPKSFMSRRLGISFRLERYAMGVYNELCVALYGLVEE